MRSFPPGHAPESLHSPFVSGMCGSKKIKCEEFTEKIWLQGSQSLFCWLSANDLITVWGEGAVAGEKIGGLGDGQAPDG